MTDTANLEDGFYWVRNTGTRWIPAEWSAAGKCFYLAGCMVKFSASDFDEIDPRPIKREDVK